MGWCGNQEGHCKWLGIDPLKDRVREMDANMEVLKAERAEERAKAKAGAEAGAGAKAGAEAAAAGKEEGGSGGRARAL
jgi:peptidoglycan hydrolase CwlO-like protein